MSKIFSKIVLLLLPVVLTMPACSELFEPGPDDILDKYFEALYNGRNEEAYSYISTTDKEIRSFKEFEESICKTDDLRLAVHFSDKVSHKILNMEETKDKAKAEIELSLPDSELIFLNVIGPVIISLIKKDDGDIVKRAVMDKYKDGNIPLITKKENYCLVREKEGWKIFFNWKKQKLLAEAEQKVDKECYHGAIEIYQSILKDNPEDVDAREGLKNIEKKQKNEEIRRLLIDARKYALHDMEEAIKRYKEILKLDPENADAQRDLKEIEYKKDYYNKVELYDLEAKYYETLLFGKVPGVRFKIKNNGNRTLDKIKVIFFF